MLKKLMVLVTLASLGSLAGCYHAVDQAAEQAAEDQAVSQTQAAWSQAVSKVDMVRGTIVQADWARAKSELDLVYKHLYNVVTAKDLTPELRSRVTRVFPTLIALQTKVDAREKDAAVLADKLGDMLKDTNDYMIGSGWMRSGGGAGKGNIHQEDRPGEDETPPIMDGPPSGDRR